MLAPATLRALAAGGHTKANYRGRELPVPFGIAIVAAALLALVPLAALRQLGGSSPFVGETATVLVYALGVAFLGLLDDVFGGREAFGGEQARGLRGHARVALAGRPSTGALKALGSLGLALYATSRLELSTGRWLLASAVLVLATNAFNLLDLRPGRAIKAFAVLGAGLALGTWDLRPLWAIGLFAGPALVVGVYDTRERAMLGDTGANLIGGLAGLWLVLALSPAGQIAALAALAAITVYGELHSISALVERTPGLRELDSWGRPSHQ